MDQEIKLAELMKQVERQMEEFERLVPQLRALGDVQILIPIETIEEICRPLTVFSHLLPGCGLRA